MLKNETLMNWLKDMTYWGNFSSLYCLEPTDFEGYGDGNQNTTHLQSRVDTVMWSVIGGGEEGLTA